MARCEDFPCCGHELGCCPDYDEETGEQLNMVCVCGAKLPANSTYSICKGCMHDPDCYGCEQCQPPDDYEPEEDDEPQDFYEPGERERWKDPDNRLGEGSSPAGWRAPR